MSEVMRCLKCGVTRPWVRWRLCVCGHDYGTGEAGAGKAESQEAWTPGEDPVGRPMRRALWLIVVGAMIITAVGLHNHVPEWLRRPSAAILVFLFWWPSPFLPPWKRRKP